MLDAPAIMLGAPSNTLSHPLQEVQPTKTTDDSNTRRPG